MSESDTDEPGKSGTDGPDEYVCEVCGESFESEAELERHVHDVGLVD